MKCTLGPYDFLFEMWQGSFLGGVEEKPGNKILSQETCGNEHFQKQLVSGFGFMCRCLGLGICFREGFFHEIYFCEEGGKDFLDDQ